MKISASKKQLARIISENGGWRDGAMWASQDKISFDVGPSVWFYGEKPKRYDSEERWSGTSVGQVIDGVSLVANWHQTALHRDEYFHLYPAPDAELVAACADVTKENKHPEYCESVMRSIPEPSDKPTIEQLAADYKAKLAIAQQAQEEADSHRCGAEAALKLLELSGAELGLVISVCETTKQDAELNITDWLDLQVGDEIKVFDFEFPQTNEARKNELMSGVCVVMCSGGGQVHIELKENLPKADSYWNATGADACKFTFIRRP